MREKAVQPTRHRGDAEHHPRRVGCLRPIPIQESRLQRTAPTSFNRAKGDWSHEKSLRQNTPLAAAPEHDLKSHIVRQLHCHREQYRRKKDNADAMGQNAALGQCIGSCGVLKGLQ